MEFQNMQYIGCYGNRKLHFNFYSPNLQDKYTRYKIAWKMMKLQFVL